MLDLISQFVTAVFLFWIYLSLVAVGLQFIFGVTRVINLAHGSLFVLGGYVAAAYAWTGVSPLLVVAVGAAAGVGLYFAVTRVAPTEFHQLLLTFTIFWLLEAAFRQFFGVGLYNTYSFAQSLGRFGDIPAFYLLAVAVLAISLTSIFILLRKTTLGLFLRAAMDNRAMAEALGVNVERVGAVGVTVGVLLSMVGGALSTMWQSMSPGLAGEILIYAFAAVAIGGLGNLMASVVAAALVSAMRTFAVFFVPELEFFILYLVVGLTLIFRPHGLFSTRVRYV